MVTMWIPTPSMTLPQRVLLYGTCVVALMNSVGLLVLFVQQNRQHALLEQLETRLTAVEQSSMVEILQEVPRGAAGMQASVGERPQHLYQYSRNKRSEELERELHQELLELQQEEGQQPHQQEASQEVGEETEKKKKKHEPKNKHRHSQRYHKAHVEDDLMVMMTYSMVPVSCTFCWATV